MKLIIPMAGRGTRVRPHSHVTPKPLLAVKGKTMVERIVDTFTRVLPRKPTAGVFVLGPDFGDEVRDQLKGICVERGMEAFFRVQAKPLGTAHAVFAAEDQLAGEGIVVFADTLFDMESNVSLEGADVVAWVKFVEDPSRFGVAVREGERIKAFVEKPQELISNEALIGIYYIKELNNLRKEIAQMIEENKTGPTGEYYLTDAFDQMLKADLIFKTASVSEWLDCGTIPALMETTKVILAKEVDDLRHGEINNSLIQNPVYIGPGAKVTNSVIGPYVSIEEGAEVNGSIVKDSIVFANARVENAILANSMIGQFAQVKESSRTINVGDHAILG
ncbi:MAG: NTP transferase domain-containing protein [Rhodothermaceae bacterium]|nr:NTP transferase domain-containing protein [Rhodothermaceae bacterium]